MGMIATAHQQVNVLAGNGEIRRVNGANATIQIHVGIEQLRTLITCDAALPGLITFGQCLIAGKITCACPAGTAAFEISEYCACGWCGIDDVFGNKTGAIELANEVLRA